MLNRYGICYHAFRSLINLTSFLYEKGILTNKDTGGIEIKRDFETAIKLIPMIAHREGFGDILADGALEAARTIGRDTEKYVVHVKGRDTIGDPRLGGLNPSAFHQIVDPRGSHAGLGKSVTFTGGRPFEILQREAKKQGMPEEAIKRSLSPPFINPGRAAKWGEDASVCWSLFGVCNQIYIHRFYRIEDLAALYSSLTGKETNAGHLMKIAERSWTIYKLHNVRAGFDRKDDTIPDVWFKPIKGKDVDYSLKD
jgi:aldehyde:ferredoxin oxidoreductase